MQSNGHPVPQVIVALTQQREINVPGAPRPYLFRGGSTLVVDLGEPAVQYAITKDIDSPTREARTIDFLHGAYAEPLSALLLAQDRGEPFALLHAFGENPASRN